MSESPTEPFEHAEHAEHVAHLGDAFLAKVSVTIAILAVLAATVGSLETIETAAAISDKNAAVLLQDRATDHWAFYQAKSIKKNMYQIAAAAVAAETPQAANFKANATREGNDEQDVLTKAKALEHQTEGKLVDSEIHEHRHHILTIAVTLLHISIAIATIAIIMRGRRWPWYTAMLMGAAGSVAAGAAYL